MRTTFAVAGLAAVASAGTYTHVETADVTVTSCSPTYTGNCPYKPEGDHTWADWETPSDPAVATTTTTTAHTWEDWTTTTSKPVDPTTTTTHSYWGDWTSSDPAVVTTTSYDHTWADWTPTTPAAVTPTSDCGVFTATAPPEWFSYLPSDVKSSIEAKWTGAPPADWCYYTYSTSTLYSTPVSPASSTPAAYTGAWTYSR
jgi:hypothetical protein